MPSLIKITDTCYIFDGRLTIGVIVNPATKSAIVIDSGLDDSSAKSLDNAISKMGFSITALVNTHSHADHCGGNALLKARHPDIKIYASSFEKPIIEKPFFEPFYLSGGAAPFKELRCKFLEAKPSSVTDVVDYENHEEEIEGVSLYIYPFPGHTPGLIGIGYPLERILYCGDTIFGEATFDAHGLLYYTNIADTLASFEKLLTLTDKFDHFVLYHGGVKNSEEIKELVARHIKKIEETQDFILSLTREPISVEELLRQVMLQYKVPDNLIQYSLTRTCVFAYLSNLQKENKIECVVDDARLVIKSLSCGLSLGH